MEDPVSMFFVDEFRVLVAIRGAQILFFYKIRHFAALESENGLGKIIYEAFAQEWNQSAQADGVVCFYVTPEVLSAYAKNWEKTSISNPGRRFTNFNFKKRNTKCIITNSHM